MRGHAALVASRWSPHPMLQQFSLKFAPSRCEDLVDARAVVCDDSFRGLSLHIRPPLCSARLIAGSSPTSTPCLHNCATNSAPIQCTHRIAAVELLFLLPHFADASEALAQPLIRDNFCVIYPPEWLHLTVLPVLPCVDAGRQSWAQQQLAAVQAAVTRACCSAKPFSICIEAIFPSPDALVAVGAPICVPSIVERHQTATTCPLLGLRTRLQVELEFEGYAGLTIPTSCHVTVGRCVQSASASVCKNLADALERGATVAASAHKICFEVGELLVVTHDRLGSCSSCSVVSAHAFGCSTGASLGR